MYPPSVYPTAQTVSAWNETNFGANQICILLGIFGITHLFMMGFWNHILIHHRIFGITRLLCTVVLETHLLNMGFHSNAITLVCSIF
mmetsp:Transcript_26294/g.33976  ORF Transcript_26294/g.33976 Transcript_26294/m.33976 type:complete len:87 (-) Transcript_26294:165-425(-)